MAYDKAQSGEDVASQIGKVLKRHNSWLGAYLPDDAVLVVASSAAIKALTSLPGVKWIVSLVSSFPWLVGVTRVNPNQLVLPGQKHNLSDQCNF